MRGTKKIDWLNHFLEFIVVVIGILLAFQLNTCREEKKETTLINQHISNIVTESNFNKKQVEKSIQNTQKNIDNVTALIKGIKEKQNTNTLSGLAYQILSYDGLYIKQTAYNSLKESGDIRFVKDFNLKNGIISLYEYYNWADGINEASLETYSKYYYPYMLENFDMTSGLIQDNGIFENKKFKNILISYQYILKIRLSQNKDTLEKIEIFLQERI